MSKRSTPLWKPTYSEKQIVCMKKEKKEKNKAKTLSKTNKKKSLIIRTKNSPPGSIKERVKNVQEHHDIRNKKLTLPAFEHENGSCTICDGARKANIFY